MLCDGEEYIRGCEENSSCAEYKIGIGLIKEYIIIMCKCFSHIHGMQKFVVLSDAIKKAVKYGKAKY